MVPKLSRVAVLVNPVNPSLATFVKYVQAEAQRVGIKVLTMEATTPQEIENAFPMMTQWNAKAAIVGTDGLFIQQYRQIAEPAAKNQLPSASSIRKYVEAGGLRAEPGRAAQARGNLRGQNLQRRQAGRAGGGTIREVRIAHQR